MNDNSIKISVAMTTYNGEKFLQKQIDSILSQTVMPLEIIICDDCSNDNTRVILQNYKKNNDPLFIIILNDVNLGYIKNFEKALSLCTGDYIALCDQDDMWEPYRLEKYMPLLNDKSLVYSDSLLIDKNDNILSKKLIKNCSTFQNKKFMSIFFKKGTVQGASMILSKNLVELSLPFPSNIPHDVWLMLISKDQGSVLFCNETKLLYRIHDSNIIGIKRSKKSIMSFLRALKYLIKRRNATLRLLYNKSTELVKLNFLQNNIKNELLYFNEFCEMIIYPKHNIQFRPFIRSFKYFSELIKIDNDYFIIPFIRILSVFYTPKKY